jgi:putative membrane protein
VTQPAGLPSAWARLSPISPVVRAGREAVAVLAVVGANSFSHGESPWIAVAVAAVAVVAAFVSWRVTRWRIHSGELQIDTGLVRRQQIRVPLTQIQGIDLVRPLLARMFGVSEVRVVLAGQGASPARLAYLAESRAADVRAQLLALAHGLAADVPAPPERPIVAVAPRRIVAAGIASPPTALAIGCLCAGVVVAVVAPAALLEVLPIFLVFVFLTIVTTWTQVSAEWDFRVAEAPDGLRLQSGLLQHRSETVPYGRIQAVRWVEPVCWRPMGWVRLEFDVARQGTAGRADNQSVTTTQALLPAGSREEARWLLSRVMPGATAELSEASGVPSRAWIRIPLARRYARFHHDPTYLSCSTGRIRPSVVIVPLAKVQSLRWEQGPWARRLRLASVYIDTAGNRFTGNAEYRSVEQAARLLATLPDLARAARQPAAP